MATRTQLIGRRLLDLPALLAASVAVDALGVLVIAKPAMRTFAGDRASALLAWASDANLSAAADHDGFVAVAHSKSLAGRVLAVDRSPDDHCAELGTLLGYPRCCADRVAALGESAIDDYAESVDAWLYEGPFRLIDTSGYRSGRALISHLPCSPTCLGSLELARRCLPVAATLGRLPVGEFAASLLGAVEIG
jgi:hypothetical protein